MINPRFLNWYAAAQTIVKFLLLLFVMYMSFRVYKITGHWEFGMLTFMVTGYLSYLTDIRRDLKDLYNRNAL